MYRIKPPDYVNDYTKKRKASIADVLRGAVVVVLLAVFIVIFIIAT